MDLLHYPGGHVASWKTRWAGSGATDQETISLSENCRWRSPVRRCHQAGARRIQPLVEVEKEEVILAALEKTGGNKTEAAVG
ncbi:hypothetical protein MJ584_01910 [Klebsiella pneumoniae]|nr:hypothetical protein MJ584_01910 [Klebsiella pneumoniae]